MISLRLALKLSKEKDAQLLKLMLSHLGRARPPNPFTLAKVFRTQQRRCKRISSSRRHWASTCNLLQPNPSMTEFLKARHFLEPVNWAVIWGSFPGDVTRANMLLHTKISFSSNLPPIDEAPNMPTMQFLDELVQTCYSTEEEKTRLKDCLKKLKLMTLNHDALETFLTEFEALSRALEEIDTFTVNRKDYLLTAVPAHVAAKIRENLNADMFETAKTLLFRIVTHEVLNPLKQTLNNAQFCRRAGGTGSMDEAERQQCMREGICFNTALPSAPPPARTKPQSQPRPLETCKRQGTAHGCRYHLR
jgi:hypothetical protein